jgi:hypothetical protein
MPKAEDEKVREKSSPNWVSEILPVPGIGQMLLRKRSRFIVLQKLVHSRGSLHEREELEVPQTDVDAAKFAYLVRHVANKANWFSSEIMIDLGCVKVLESTPRSNSPEAAMVPAEMPPIRYLKYLSRCSCMWKACPGDPMIYARLGKILVKWVAVVEDMLQDWMHIVPDEESCYENNYKGRKILCHATSSRIQYDITRHWE